MKGHLIICAILALIIYAISHDWIVVAIGVCAYIATALILFERKLHYIDQIEQDNKKQE